MMISKPYIGPNQRHLFILTPTSDKKERNKNYRNFAPSILTPQKITTYTPPLTSHFSPPPSAWLHNPTLSLWLSVDPLSDKYPEESPYVYCADNPVRLVDVDGRDVWLIGTEDERNNAFYDMQNGTNLPLTMDENGRIILAPN